MHAPQPTGAYTDEAGTLRCRATGKRCLGHRQAAELVARARTRGETAAERYHCAECSAWHYSRGYIGRRSGKAKAPRAPAKVRRFRRQLGL